MELKRHQPPLPVEEQIENLKSLGLIISDEEYAKSILNDISYFRLIKAYSSNLKERNTGFYKNVSFEHILELYLFNANFRQLLFTEIEHIEVNLRCRIANYFSCTYGVLGYQEANNFVNTDYHNEFLGNIESEIYRNKKNPFVKNFQENYEGGTIPLYALMELFSFGTLSKFYKNMKSEDKKAVAGYYHEGYTYLESWFEHISYVRNICAHYGRLYNAKLIKTPKLYKQYTEKGVKNNKVFATLLCIKHLLPHDRHWRFIETLALLIEKYSHVEIELMGFPENWEELLI